MKNLSNYSPKIIRLTENDLVKIIEKVILESKRDLLNKNKKMEYSDFVEKAQTIHQHKYSYPEENDITWDGIEKTGPIKVECQYHEPFYITPLNHIHRKSGCPKCRQKENFEKKAKKYHSISGTPKYTGYTEIELSDKNLNKCNEIELFCPVKANNFPDGNLNNFEEEPHGYFTVSPSNHIDPNKKVGCPKCPNAKGKNIKDDKFTWLDKIIKSNESFLENGKLIYDYNETIFTKMNEMVTVTCPKHGHGPWPVRASAHLHDESGCPKCLKFEESKGELSTANYFNKNKISVIAKKVFDGCKGRPNRKGTCRLLKFDFYLPELKTAVEIDGRYHFEEIHGNDLQSQIINDERKNEFVENLETIEPEKLIRIEYNSGKIDDLIKDLGDLLEKIKSEKKGTILLSDKYPKKGWNDPNNRD